MNSRIDQLLCLDDDGKTVQVNGPIVSWEADEVSAVVSVVITQMKANRKIAVATGISGQVVKASNPTQWSAVARGTPGPGPEFGQATAYATAIVQHDNGTFEPYNWPVQIRLVECVDGQPVEHDGDA